MLQKRIDDQPSISPEMVREAQGILHQHLKRVGLKQTAQRDTILRTFLETREHLSTDELHRLVKKKTPGSVTRLFTAHSNCWPSVAWPAKSPFMMASPATNISTTGVATIIWFARIVAVRSSSFLARSKGLSRRSVAAITMRRRAIPSRFTGFAKIVARRRRGASSKSAITRAVRTWSSSFCPLPAS